MNPFFKILLLYYSFIFNLHISPLNNFEVPDILFIEEKFQIFLIF
jgi:hypothetical protein